MDVITNSHSFLFEVYVNDFNDNYHRTNDEPSTDLEKAARKIRRRYKKFSDYLEAMAVYNEYMAVLAVKHGGPRLFKIFLKNEQIDEFIPAKPRMKNTAFNKALIKKGIVLSKINVTEIDEDMLEEVIGSMSEDIEADGIYIQYAKPNKTVNRLIRDTRITTKDVKDIRKISSIDYLEEYFYNKNLTKRKEIEEENTAKLTVTDIMNGKEEDYLKDTSEQDDVILYNGSYMRRSAVEELQIFHELKDMGWNSVKIMKQKGISQRVAKRFEKSEKKQSKKDKRRAKKDGFLIDVAMGNGYSADTFGDFEQDMLNFTSEQVFKR